MDWVERILWMYIGVLVVNIFKEVKKWYYEGVQAKDYKRMVKQSIKICKNSTSFRIRNGYRIFHHGIRRIPPNFSCIDTFLNALTWW